MLKLHVARPLHPLCQLPLIIAASLVMAAAPAPLPTAFASPTSQSAAVTYTVYLPVIIQGAAPTPATSSRTWFGRRSMRVPRRWPIIESDYWVSAEECQRSEAGSGAAREKPPSR